MARDSIRPEDSERPWTQAELADYFGVSRTLPRVWRARGIGPPYARRSNRPWYFPSDVYKWEREQVKSPKQHLAERRKAVTKKTRTRRSRRKKGSN